MDLLIHDADYCISLWGMPDSVRARGHQDMVRGVDIIHAELDYPGLGPVVISGGWHQPDTFPFTMEYTVATDETTYEWSSAAASDPQGADPFAAELAYFADCATRNIQPARCPPRQSAQAVALAERMIESRARNGALC
jgi:predicted dehydrogenase